MPWINRENSMLSSLSNTWMTSSQASRQVTKLVYGGLRPSDIISMGDITIDYTVSGASIRSAVWNWWVKSLSPGAHIFLSYFCSSNFFPPILIFVFGPTICPWVSEDATSYVFHQLRHVFPKNLESSLGQKTTIR